MKKRWQFHDQKMAGVYLRFNNMAGEAILEIDLADFCLKEKELETYSLLQCIGCYIEYKYGREI